MENAGKYDLGLLGKWLDGGLCHGAGDGKSKVCLEQAVALCAGLPLTDQPDSCVAPAVSAFGRRLNDRAWSSAKARGAGLRELAFAQLGTAGKLDERKWVKRVAELIIRETLPVVFRKVAALPRLAAHRESLLAAADKCKGEGTAASALEARKIADAAAADAEADAYADAAEAAEAYAAYADAYAAYAAYAEAFAAYAAAAEAFAAYAEAAEAYASYAEAAEAYASYANAADAADAARSAARDKMLTSIAMIGVRAIREQIPAEASS